MPGWELEELLEELSEELLLSEDELSEDVSELLLSELDDSEEELLGDVDELEDDELELPLSVALYTSNSAICGAPLALSITRLILYRLWSPNPEMIRSEPSVEPLANTSPVSWSSRRQPVVAPFSSRMMTVLKLLPMFFTPIRSSLLEPGCQ